MRILAILVVLLGWRVASADRANAIAGDLRLDPVAASKVISTLRSYDGELVRLREQRAELRRRMIDPPPNAQKLLDDSIENSYAIQAAEELLVSELRRNLTAQQTVRVLVLLSATEPDAMAATLTSGRCDPFKQMHRCP